MEGDIPTLGNWLYGVISGMSALGLALWKLFSLRHDIDLMEQRLSQLEKQSHELEDRIVSRLERLEAKLDSLILRKE